MVQFTTKYNTQKVPLPRMLNPNPQQLEQSLETDSTFTKHQEEEMDIPQQSKLLLQEVKDSFNNPDAQKNVLEKLQVFFQAYQKCSAENERLKGELQKVKAENKSLKQLKKKEATQTKTQVVHRSKQQQVQSKRQQKINPVENDLLDLIDKFGNSNQIKHKLSANTDHNSSILSSAQKNNFELQLERQMQKEDTQRDMYKKKAQEDRLKKSEKISGEKKN